MKSWNVDSNSNIVLAFVCISLHLSRSQFELDPSPKQPKKIMSTQAQTTTSSTPAPEGKAPVTTKRPKSPKNNKRPATKRSRSDANSSSSSKRIKSAGSKKNPKAQPRSHVPPPVGAGKTSTSVKSLIEKSAQLATQTAAQTAAQLNARQSDAASTKSTSKTSAKSSTKSSVEGGSISESKYPSMTSQVSVIDVMRDDLMGIMDHTPNQVRIMIGGKHTIDQGTRDLYIALAKILACMANPGGDHHALIPAADGSGYLFSVHFVTDIVKQQTRHSSKSVQLGNLSKNYKSLLNLYSTPGTSQHLAEFNQKVSEQKPVKEVFHMNHLMFAELMICLVNTQLAGVRSDIPGVLIPDDFVEGSGVMSLLEEFKNAACESFKTYVKSIRHEMRWNMPDVKWNMPDMPWSEDVC